MIGADTLIKKVGTGGLVAESHPATEQLKATTAYRYTGADPNNYVSFNNELWRIIGVFETDDGTGVLEQRIKLIRKDSIGNIAWNTDGSSNWKLATGMTLLNSGDYWNRKVSYASTGLTEEARNMIGDAKWYLSGTSDYGTTSTAKNFYSYERGSHIYFGLSTSWVGKVGLMYPSDYGYATGGGTTISRTQCLSKGMFYWRESEGMSDCYLNDWLYDNNVQKWVLTPYTGDLFYGTYVHQDGFVAYTGVAASYALFPSLFLRPNIEIIDGVGTESDPYQLSL